LDAWEEHGAAKRQMSLGLQLLARQNSDASDPKIFVIFAVFCVKSWKTGRAMAPDHIQSNQTLFSGF
jgi:hypothetical protein